MKKLLALLVPVSMYASAGVVPAPVDHLFVPNGFDNNDNVEMVVTGKFPTNCYSRNKVETKVSGEIVDVTVSALFNDGRACELSNVPFSENITVGTLQGGKYKVRVNGKEMGALKVDEARSDSVDDHIYAQVDYVELGFTGGLTGSAFLIGKKTMDCVELDHVEYVSNGSDTLAVLPIMKKVSNVCNEVTSYLEIPIKYDLNRFNFKQTLLFVRTLDGKSVNGIVTRQ
jgi:hypothetical protein